MRVATVAVLWLASRAWLVWLLNGPQAWVDGDVFYFLDSLDALPQSGLSGTLVEYPVPAVGVLAGPWLLAGWLEGVASYATLFHAVAALTDLAFTVLLFRACRGRSLLPVGVWVLAVPLLGSTAFARFDLLPGVLCGLTVLLLARRPAVAAVLATAATAVKLWPVLLLPALLGVADSRRRVVAAAGLTGLALVAVSLPLGGWDRLVSPLGYQAERGLQVESVLATPVMLGWALTPDRWAIGYAASKSFEIDGPGVALLLGVSTLLSVLYLVGLLAAWYRLATLARQHSDVAMPATVWLVLTSVSGFMVVGKVLSPQYLLWLLPVAAAGLVVADSRALRAWAGALLVATALTQVIFPTGYASITAGTGPVVAVVLALAVRNLIILGLFLTGAERTWRALVGPQPDSALVRQPPGPERTAGRIAR